MALYSKPVILVIISPIVLALIHGPSSTLVVFAVPPDANWGESRGTCEESDLGLTVTCCWREKIPGSILGESYCQTCKKTVTGNGITIDCDPKELQFKTTPPTTGETVLPGEGVLEQPPTPPPSGPAAPPLQDGVLEQPPETPSPPPSRLPGQTVLPGDTGVLEQPPPADQGEAEPTIEGNQSRVFSPTGGCSTLSKTRCIPCDLGLPGAACIPDSQWPPVLSTDTDTPQATEPPTPPVTSPLGEVAPEAEIPPAEQGTQPPPEPLPPCPEGQILDEQSGLCVPIESPEAEEPEAAEEPQAEDQEQPSEEGGSEDNNNN